MAEQQVQPLHNEKHANTKIKNGINVEFMKTQHLVPVVAHEFARVANEFPLRAEIRQLCIQMSSIRKKAVSCRN